jgi:hypothetical protein
MPQTPTPVRLGYQAAIRITPVVQAGFVGPLISRFFGAHGSEIEMDSDEHECGDTLSGRAKRYKYGRTSFSGRIDFYEKDSLNIHDPPASPTSGGFSLKNGQFIYFEVWMQGLVSDITGQPLLPYVAPVFGVKNVRISFDEEGKVMGSFTGKADGDWYRPGETIPP